MRSFIVYEQDPKDSDIYRTGQGTAKVYQAFNEHIASQFVLEDRPDIGPFILGELSYNIFNEKED